MEETSQNLEEMIEAGDFDPEQLGARFWFEQYRQQREQNQQLKQQFEQLRVQVTQQEGELNKLKQRTSQNSSQPPPQDGYKKANQGSLAKMRDLVLRKLAPDVRTMVELGATTRSALCG